MYKMETRKSMHMHKRLESSLNKSPASSSPLRRKSIVAQEQLPNILSENDDEAERIVRRAQINTPITTLSAGSNKRHSLGLGFLANVPTPQMAESINQCIKLSAENKINIKNAFSLEVIDFMTYMIKKQDNNMSNLQVASTSLDVSSKIYGFRVDSVHTEIIKIMGGLDKQAIGDAEEDQDNLEEARQENTDADFEVLKKKKKKRVRQKICSTVEALRGHVEIVKPLSMMIGEGDLQTSDMLYQVMLPNHASSGYYQHLYNDVLVDVAEQVNDVNSTEYVIPVIKNFRNLDIYASYENFQFVGWSVEDEPEKTSDTSVMEFDNDDENSEAGNHFLFDLDASAEQQNENTSEHINYFDIGTQDDEHEHKYEQRQAPIHGEKIVNAPTVAGSSKLVVTSEYSFVLPSTNLHWAGPLHWKFHNLRKPLTGSNAGSKLVGTCMQAPLRKKKEIELSYEGQNEDVIESKFALSQSVKLQAKTAKMEWNSENLLLPEDVHYDVTRMFKLYLHQYLNIKSQDNDDKVVTVADLSDNDKYDYNNPNDTLEYCPDVDNDDYDEGKDNNDGNECNFEFENDGNPCRTQGLTGDNLIAAPKLANKISIAYCLKMKKIDMRQLKKTIWKCLRSTENADETNGADAMQQMEADTMKKPKQFSDVYKTVPKLLSKNNAESLSVSLFLTSLLHLANEKTLNMSSLPGMSDIIVEKL